MRPQTTFTKATVNTSSLYLGQQMQLQSPPPREKIQCYFKHWCEVITSITSSKVCEILSATCVFSSPAGRPHSSHVCSPSQPVHGGEACAVRSSSPMRCEHAGGHCNCAPGGGTFHTLMNLKGSLEVIKRNAPPCSKRQTSCFQLLSQSIKQLLSVVHFTYCIS